MADVVWAHYPLAASFPSVRSWLTMQMNLQLADKTLDAYARSLEDYLAFCTRTSITPETVTREHLAAYVHDLATRPNPRGAQIFHLHSGAGLSNATMQLRLTAVRLYYDSLLEQGLRSTNPVGRGKYTPGKGFFGERDRALIPRFQKVPFVPTDDQWRAVLEAVREEPLRNRVMFLLAYEGALRREEVVTLELGDIDPAFRQITIRAEAAKTGKGRVVFYSAHTGLLLGGYLRERRVLSLARGPLFLSVSHRNRAEGLSPRMWSFIVERIAARANVPQFTSHTLRHLRLTQMARADMDIHHIALYAGHATTQTTLLYIHLSGRDLSRSVTRSLADVDRWIASVMGGPEP